jgi:hypothetical protein
VLILESPVGPLQDRLEPAGLILGGTASFGVSAAGKAFYDPAPIPASEQANIAVDPVTGRPLVRSVK